MVPIDDRGSALGPRTGGWLLLLVSHVRIAVVIESFPDKTIDERGVAPFPCIVWKDVKCVPGWKEQCGSHA
jgi:hypothetical protein